MSDISNALSGYFFNIANAIREKTGRNAPIPLNNMVNEIGSISGGEANYDSFYVISGNNRWLAGVRFKNLGITPDAPVIIGNNVTYCGEMFFQADNFNQTVTMSDSVVNCRGMFGYADRFNQPVNIPNGVIDCASMFAGTDTFNQPVIIPDSVVDCSYMFSQADNFNQSVTIGNNALNCSGMFIYADNFNQPVIIPNGVRYCNDMFRSATNFNQPVTIPDSVVNCTFMFAGAKQFAGNIYIKGSTNLWQVNGMIQHHYDSNKRINIFFNSAYNSLFNNAKSTYSITGYNMNWIDMLDGNGFYDTTYNIYCYNNYTG